MIASVDALLVDAHANGGWGLTAEFAADSLETALALTGLDTAGFTNAAEFEDFTFLVIEQNADGGWSCVLQR